MNERHLPTTSAAPMADAASLYRQWAAGPLVYGRWLIALLDSQTAWWKAAEGCLAGLAQPVFDPRVAAARYASSPHGGTPFADAALQLAWEGWARLWLDALRHDATET